MNYKNKPTKKSQAAIEFLMTYGWMLLIVLIVGALIFSFVDFGSLLPEQVDLSPPLRGDSGLVSARVIPGGSTVSFIVAFTGARSAQLVIEKGGTGNTQIIYPTIVPQIGSGTSCTLIGIGKSDNWESQKTNIVDNVQVISGNSVRAEFNCGNLVAGDVFEGKAVFKVRDSKTSFDKISEGRIRVKIQ